MTQQWQLFPTTQPAQWQLFPSNGSAGGFGNVGMPSQFPSGGYGAFDYGQRGYSPYADSQDELTLQSKINETNTVAAGSAPPPTGEDLSPGVGQLGGGHAPFQGHLKTYDTAMWNQAGQWDDEIIAASQEYGVPADRIKATMMIESGGQMYNPDGSLVTQTNPYNGNSYGLMQIVPTAAGAACTDSWCGWGDGSPQTKQTGVNHDINTPGGNLMMGAMILRDGYDRARQLYPNATDDQLWDMASSAFFVGNMQWSGQDSVNGNTGVNYKEDLDGLIAAMGPVGGQLPGQDPASVQAPSELVDKPSGNTLVDAALSFVGSKYVLGAPYGTAGPGEPTYFDAHGRPTAFDCSGFVAYLAKTYLGRDITTGSHEQYADNSIPFVTDGSLQPGDILFFNTGTSFRGNAASHVGIFLGYDAQGVPWMINALNEDAGVVVTALNDQYWNDAYMGAKRLTG